MTVCIAKAIRPMCLLSVLFVLFTSTIVLQPAQAQTTQNAKLDDKAMSFLSDVLQLDMSKYRVAYNSSDGIGGLNYHFDVANSPFSPSPNQIIAYLTFYNGTLATCNLYTTTSTLIYANTFPDRYNATIGILERYQAWTNDSRVAKMVAQLQQLGGEKNATEIAGNSELKILIQRTSVAYSFSDYFNGVEYPGLTISYSTTTGDVLFHDSRFYQTIGDTSVNLSKEQAVSVAENYIRNYSYNITLGNGTRITASNFNVTGVNAAGLQSMVRENQEMYPYWDVWLNVTNMPSRGLQGFDVKVWANDGTVASVNPFYVPYYSLPPTGDPFYPIFYGLLIAVLGFLVFVVVLAVVLIIVFTRKPKTIEGGQSLPVPIQQN